MSPRLLQDTNATLPSHYEWNVGTRARIFDLRPIPVFRDDPENMARGVDYSRAVYCSQCSYLGHGYDDDCCECEQPALSFAVLDSVLDIVHDQTAVRSRRWFHATQRGAHWMEKVLDAEVLVHVGSFETSRQLVLGNSDFRPHKDTAPWHLYELELTETATIGEGVRADLATDWPIDIHDIRTSAIAYLNVFEAPGDISLLARPGALRVVSTMSFSTAAELVSTELSAALR